MEGKRKEEYGRGGSNGGEGERREESEEWERVGKRKEQQMKEGWG